MGGISNYILSLSSALKQKGVGILALSSGGDLESEFLKRGIEINRVDIKTKFEYGPKVIKSIFKLVRIIQDEDIDIIHAHTRVTQVAACFASGITHVPYVATCHGFFKKRLGRQMFDCWGRRVIAISEPVRKGLIEDFKISSDRIEVIHNGVDLDRFSKTYSPDEISQFKRNLGLNDSPIIGTIGRLSSVKGHSIFIDAIADMLHNGYKVQAFIVGDGPEGKYLKGLVRRLGIEESFHFFGSAVDTSGYLSVMDIFVFPSIKEGLGLSLLEALASGRPSISSDVGGISDIIKDKENGLLFQVGDVRVLRDSIIHLLEDEAMRRRLGEAGKNLVREKFSLDRMANQILNLYKNVLRNDEA